MINEVGWKTLLNYRRSPRLRPDDDRRNIRCSLSGMYFYDSDKAEKWLNELLGAGQRFWYEEA